MLEACCAVSRRFSMFVLPPLFCFQNFNLPLKNVVYWTMSQNILSFSFHFTGPWNKWPWHGEGSIIRQTLYISATNYIFIYICFLEESYVFNINTMIVFLNLFSLSRMVWFICQWHQCTVRSSTSAIMESSDKIITYLQLLVVSLTSSNLISFISVCVNLTHYKVSLK